MSVDDLFTRATVGLDSDDHAPLDNPTGWTAIMLLRRTASREVLDAALVHCAHADPLKRQVGADVLAQLGHSTLGFHPIFVEERVAGLLRLLATEQTGIGHPQVLNSACVAFGHLHDTRAVPELLNLQHHPHGDVRRGVAFGLSSYDLPEAIDGLIALSTDPLDEIRDWATFGLGQLIKSDTPAIRAAFRGRLDDPCLDARNEAIEGLAIRGDLSVVPILIRELVLGNVSSGLLDAAAALATVDLCEALRAAGDHGLVWQNGDRTLSVTENWQDAMTACGCEARTRL